MRLLLTLAVIIGIATSAVAERALVFVHGAWVGEWYWDGVQIRSDYDDKCLDAYVGSSNVGMWECHGGDNQKWYWDGEKLKNGDGKCLDYKLSNDNVIDYTCTGNANQRWLPVNQLMPLIP